MQEIAAALEKAADWLASRQKPDGSWPADRQSFSMPVDWLSEFFVTCHASRALLLADMPGHVENIQRAVTFCAGHDIEKGDPVSWHAMKLLALQLSDSADNRKHVSRLVKTLVKKQDSRGFWPLYPATFNPTNYMIVSALAGSGTNEGLDGAARWFRNCMSADRLGWGRDGDAKKAQVTSTAKVSLSLLLCGERLDSRHLQAARRFLECGQNRDGSWNSPRFRVPSTDSTACSALALMLLSKSPFNDRTKNAVNWLLNTQNKAGGWPHSKGDPSTFFMTSSAMFALAFWRHLHEQWERPEISELRERMGKQATAIWLWRHLPTFLKERFERLLVRSMLDSKALGSTKAAIMRRKEILRILSEEGPGDTAEVIDKLKPLPEYAHLSKKSHITQIKNDLDYLRDINLVSLVRGRYAVVKDFLRD